MYQGPKTCVIEFLRQNNFIGLKNSGKFRIRSLGLIEVICHSKFITLPYWNVGLGEQHIYMCFSQNCLIAF